MIPVQVCGEADHPTNQGAHEKGMENGTTRLVIDTTRLGVSCLMLAARHPVQECLPSLRYSTPVPASCGSLRWEPNQI